MSSIVVPVNFSANSANAARYATDLAFAMGADIHLLYVFQLPVSLSEVPMPETAFDNLRNSCLELLSDLQQELTTRTFGKVRVTTLMQIGAVEQVIESFCKLKKPLLVVMGASGDTFENLLAGSSTKRALHHLRYPVLVVPANAKFKTIRKIVIACDRSDIDSGMPHALQFLKELTGLLGSQLEAVHAIAQKESASEASIEYNRWKNDVSTLGPALHFINEPHLGQGLCDYTAKHQADWLMVSPKRHSFLEFHRSRSNQLVEKCTVPILSLHE